MRGSGYISLRVVLVHEHVTNKDNQILNLWQVYYVVCIAYVLKIDSPPMLPPLLSSFSLFVEKSLAQGPPGGILGILGVVVVFGLVVGVMVTICMVYKRGQKTRTGTDTDP